jgi:hypothetical protein
MIYRTIKEQISEGKALEITDKELRYHETINLGDYQMVINTTTLLSKYKDNIKQYIAKYKFSPTDALKYQYKPTLLSNDLYGTIELATFILQINKMISANEFTDLEKGIYLFNSGFTSFINEILTLEEKELRRNRDTVISETNE